MMLLQRFESPRTLRDDLGAGVCAGALLQGQGLAALVTSPRSRLLLQPLGGATGSVIDVALEAVQEIALLSKDVAVVLDSEHVLWSLSGLFASARAQKVARDVRCLCARPSGESALALGVDGKARALTLNRGAVAVRAFGLRGTLRACDVGEHVTYAVFDGKGGGQIRVHPGATPELSTSAKAALPDGAAALDRVRGGEALSVIFKRGDATVCVVRGPNKLEAKLVQLEAKPVDAAVLDGSLFVAFADGRLALYDGEALARAGDAALAPTSEVALAAAGEPQVIFTAPTKAGVTVWVGTSTGEVLSVTLAAHKVAAHKEKAEAQAKPRAKASAEDVPVKAPRASAEEAPMKAPKASAEEAPVNAAKVSAEEEIPVKAKASAEEVPTKGAKASAEEAKPKAKASAPPSDAELVAERDALKAELAAVKAAHAKEIAALEAHTNELAARELALAQEKRGHEARLEALEAELDLAREKQESAEQHAAALPSSLAAKDLELIAAKERHAAAEAKLASREEENNRLEGEVQELQRKLGMVNEQVRGVEAELASRTRDRDALQAELDALQSRAWASEEQARGREAELASRAAELARAQAELAEAQGKLAASEERARGREAELATRTRERDELRAEIGRISAELTREREQVERPSLLGIPLDSRLSIKSARAALDAVVTQLQSIVLRRPRG